MPPGWTQQWDQNSQRWFYIEQATGRTQWDPPSHLPPGPYAPPAAGAPYMPAGGHDERGLFGNTHGHQGHDYTQSGAATNAAEKKKGHSTAMLAAAGVGGIAAGAFIGHQLGMLPFTYCTIVANNSKATTAMTRNISSHMPLQRRRPQLLQAATVLTPDMALLLQQILMRMTRPLLNLPQFPPMTQTVTPFQVVTVSPWRRSARRSSRRRRSIKRNSRRITMIRRRIPSLSDWYVTKGRLHERNGRTFLTLIMNHGYC
jgi:hypothetical protein